MFEVVRWTVKMNTGHSSTVQNGVAFTIAIHESIISSLMLYTVTKAVKHSIFTKFLSTIKTFMIPVKPLSGVYETKNSWMLENMKIKGTDNVQ